MSEKSSTFSNGQERLRFIREETRFEIELLHGRINALIGAEAFLMIAFTAAMSSNNPHWGGTFAALAAPVLSIVGLLLAVLSWPGVDASFRIILEWNAHQVQLMNANLTLNETLWRQPVLGRRSRRADPDPGWSMIFARAVPIVFTAAWAILTLVALILPRLRWTG